jgi:hypothetical protein
MVRATWSFGVTLVATSLLASAQLLAAAEGGLKPLDPPDPASISVPHMPAVVEHNEAGDYDAYFYFYKPGVSYKSAFADYDQCRMYALTTKSVAVPPRFVPLGSDVIQEKKTTPAYWGYGVVGIIISEIFVEQDRRDTDRATIKRCMAYKGYLRYGTSEAIWTEINAGDDAESVARKALIASGPKPAAEAIDP